MKAVWLTVLDHPEPEIKSFFKKLQAYGLDCAGHQWDSDTRNMAWMGAIEELIRPQCTLWAIVGSRQAFSNSEIRYGLSLLALCAGARRGSVLPLVIVQTLGEALSLTDLPLPLQRGTVLSAGHAGTPAKMVAKSHAQAPDIPSAYHFDMVGNPQFGQWFEVRPTRDEWPGIIFGVDKGEIKFQAVGPSGQLPETCTLNYPMQGIRMEFGGRTFQAWAVRNTITPQSAYYVKVEGCPESVLLGPFSEDNEARMYRLDLK